MLFFDMGPKSTDVRPDYSHDVVTVKMLLPDDPAEETEAQLAEIISGRGNERGKLIPFVHPLAYRELHTHYCNILILDNTHLPWNTTVASAAYRCPPLSRAYCLRILGPLVCFSEQYHLLTLCIFRKTT